MFQSGFFYRFVGCCLLDDHHPEAEVTRLQQQARKRDLDDKAREAKGKGKGKAREGAKESNQKPAKAPRRRRRPKPQLSLSPRSHRLRQLRQIQVMRLVRLRSQVREAVPRRPPRASPCPCQENKDQGEQPHLRRQVQANNGNHGSGLGGFAQKVHDRHGSPIACTFQVSGRGGSN
jgi:hypothetical protein